MEAQNTRHELSNIYWTALFNLGANTFMISHLIFFCYFWKWIICDLWEYFQFFIQYGRAKTFMMSHLNFFMISENELYVIYGNISNLLFLLFANNPTSWNFWPQFQMGFVYICQEWLSKIGAAHMCSMDQGSLNTTVSWQ